MTTAAVMLVKDEADVIEPVVRHLLTQVDLIVVADNLSSDGTLAKLNEIAEELPDRVYVSIDDEVGYRQAKKTTRLAALARGFGAKWVVPCDADEVWYSPFGRIGDVLEALPREVLFARAPMLNHITTSEDDPADANPVTRIGWRFNDPVALAKVACRTSPDLVIDMGNHEAVSTGRVRSNWDHNLHGQLTIRHFPWRSEEQYHRKIRNGALAYAAAPELDVTYGEHWKAYGLPGDPGFDTRVRDWFWKWGYRAEPRAALDLIYDPAPAQR